MESSQYFWAGIGITLLLLPIIQWYYCRVARQNVEKHMSTGGRVRLPDGRDSEPRPLDKEDIDEESGN